MILRSDEVADLPTPNGLMRTYVFRPVAAGRYPGLVLFSEIFQVTAPIRRTAALLAGHGFVVAVPEVYHELEPTGTVLPYDTAGADLGNAHKTIKELASYDADARAVLDFLKGHPACTGDLGVFGMCLGGHLAFRAAMNPDVKAGVCFYATDIHKRSLGKGMNDDTLDRMKEIKGELLMIWGRQDPHVPQEGRAHIYKTMTEAGLCFTWHEFNAAHAFLRDEGPRYDPELALRCYGIAVDLLQRKLRFPRFGGQAGRRAYRKNRLYAKDPSDLRRRFSPKCRRSSPQQRTPPQASGRRAGDVRELPAHLA